MLGSLGMGPWPLARFGAAAELIGRREASSHPLVAALGPELLAQTAVVLGTDLESIGVATQLQPGGDGLQRCAVAAERASGPDARKFFEERGAAAGVLTVTATVHASGATYSIEHRNVGAHATRDGAARLGVLQQNVDHVVEQWATTGDRVTRIGAVTDSRLIVTGILERSGIPAEQQSYVADTLPIWTKANPQIIVRLAFGASGVVDEVGLVFRDVPGEHLVRVWRTFQPRSDGAQRIGAFVGAMGIETADRFELRLRRAGEPLLEATFIPVSAPFSR